MRSILHSSPQTSLNNLEVLNYNCTVALGRKNLQINPKPPSPPGWVQRFPEKVSMVICVQTLKTHSNKQLKWYINTCYHGTPWKIDTGNKNKKKRSLNIGQVQPFEPRKKKLLRSRLNLNLPIGFHPNCKKTNPFFEGWWWFHHPTPVNEHSWR